MKIINKIIVIVISFIAGNSNAVINFANNTDTSFHISYKDTKSGRIDELDIANKDTATLHTLNLSDISEMKLISMGPLTREYPVKNLKELKSDTKGCGSEGSKLVITKSGIFGYDVSATCYQDIAQGWESIGD